MISLRLQTDFGAFERALKCAGVTADLTADFLSETGVFIFKHGWAHEEGTHIDAAARDKTNTQACARCRDRVATDLWLMTCD